MAAQSKLETVPVEIVYNILSYLVYPRSRLPGLTERQSSRDCPEEEKKAAKDAYHLNPTAPPDSDRFAENIFLFKEYQHPFNALALTSRKLRGVTERHCAHLVKKCNRFNIPLSHIETHGSDSVFPDLTLIVYRRLWLQYAPRLCVFCNAVLSSYPHTNVKKPIVACRECFFSQVYNIREVEEQFHLTHFDLMSNGVRGSPTWVLRIDVDRLALRLYGTKAFHDIPRRLGQRNICTICLQTGTLARSLQLRLQWESEKWQVQPNTSGWLVRPKAEDTSEQAGDTKWFKLLKYRQDEYLYDEDFDLDGGYHLCSLTPGVDVTTE